MDWSEILQGDEQLLWQGKPAPRCYTFRNWPHSLFGLVLLLSCLVWFYIGIDLEQQYQQAHYALLPLPFLLLSLYLIAGHLIKARLEWDAIYYGLSDRRLLVRRGLMAKKIIALPLEEVVWFVLRPHSETLGTVTVRCRGEGPRLTLCCIEQPRQLTDLLESVLERNGISLQPRNDESLQD